MLYIVGLVEHLVAMEKAGVVVRNAHKTATNPNASAKIPKAKKFVLRRLIRCTAVDATAAVSPPISALLPKEARFAKIEKEGRILASLRMKEKIQRSLLPNEYPKKSRKNLPSRRKMLVQKSCQNLHRKK